MAGFGITEALSPKLAAETIMLSARISPYEIQCIDRSLRDHIRLGRLTLVVGLAELTLSLSAGHLRQSLREGLVITGLVVPGSAEDDRRTFV